MSFLLEHTRFGFCWLDLLALIILASVVAYAYYMLKKANDKKKDLQERLDELEQLRKFESESGVSINSIDTAGLNDKQEINA